MSALRNLKFKIFYDSSGDLILRFIVLFCSTGITKLCEYVVTEPDGGLVTVTFTTIDLAGAPDACSASLVVSIGEWN